MPDNVFPRMKLVRTSDMPPPPIAPAPYVELGVATPFSFLRGASDANALVLRALAIGMDAIGIADRNTLAGVVRMHGAAKEAGLKPLIGCRLDLTDASSGGCTTGALPRRAGTVFRWPEAEHLLYRTRPYSKACSTFDLHPPGRNASLVKGEMPHPAG
jgi:hypothetical protein